MRAVLVVQWAMSSQRLASTSFSLSTRFRNAWATGLSCSSDVAFAFGVSFLWLLLYNAHFWRLTFDAMWRLNPRTLLFTVSLFVLGLSLQALPLLVCPTRRLMRVLASLMFVVAALAGYFGEVYGAIVNQDMMRNVLQTGATEALSLLNADVAIHVILLRILPAALGWRIRRPRTPSREEHA